MDFFTFMQDLGITPPSQQILTRTFTRWGKNGKYYAIAIDSEGGQGYVCGDWSTGEIWSWFPKTDNDISIKEAQERRSLVKAARELEQAQREADWLNVSQKIKTRLKALERGRNTYLDKKGIQGDFLIDGEKLVIPLSDIDGETWTVQTIDSTGKKMLASGGKKKGCFHRFGNIGDVIYVCEGFATAWSVYSATGECAIMAVDVHNLKPVVDALVIKYSKDKVVICADNDGGDNGGIGVLKAKELESSLGVRVVIPAEKGDFNDIFQKDGAKAVRDLLIDSPKENIGSYDLPDSKELGLVGEITDWIMETSIRPQYPLALSAALCFVGMAKGHKVETETGLRTNLLALSIGLSTSGKDYPRTAIEHLSTFCDLSDFMAGDLASGTALVDGLYASGGKQLIQIDEIGRMLQAIGSKNSAGYQMEIITTIMKMFSSASTRYRGKQYARRDGKKVEPIIVEQPCLCINGSTVSDNFYAALTGESIVDGFLNRWLLFESKEFRPPINKNKKKISAPPARIADAVKDIQRWDARQRSYGSDIQLEPAPVTVHYTPKAKKMIDAMEIEIEAVIMNLYEKNDNMFPLWGRAMEHIAKVALILANDHKITESNVKNAYAIVMHCVSMMVDAVRSNIASNDYERKKQIILRIIKNNGGSAKLSFISPRCNMPSKEYKEVLSTLVEGNILIERKQSTGGNKPTLVYELI